MNPQDTTQEYSQNHQPAQTTYDMITVAVQDKAGFSNSPTGFMYLKDSRLVFVTERGTIFDVPIAEIEAVDAGSKFSSFRVTINGKKFRIKFFGENAEPGAKEYMSQPILNDLISRLLPSRPTTPDRNLAAKHFLVPLSEEDFAEIPKTWQSVLIEHNPNIPMPVHNTGLFGRLFKSSKPQSYHQPPNSQSLVKLYIWSTQNLTAHTV